MPDADGTRAPAAGTEAPEPASPGEASPAPVGFTLVLWVGAASVVLWVMLRWFGRISGRPAERLGPDDTLED